MAYDKVVDSGVMDGKLTAIADAIRGKTGKTEEMTLDQMVTEIAGITGGGGGDDSILRSILDKTITEFKCDTAINFYAERFFEDCTSLVSVDLPNVKTFYLNNTYSGTYAFNGCTALKNVNLISVEQLAMGLFKNCTALEEISLPSFFKFNNNGTFDGCTSLRKVDFGAKVISGGGNSSQVQFKNCTSLKTLVLRAEDKIWALSNINTFDGTPFAEGGTGGTVYCPQSLISQYQQATNWSTLYAAGTCNFVAIEGSEYE